MCRQSVDNRPQVSTPGWPPFSPPHASTTDRRSVHWVGVLPLLVRPLRRQPTVGQYTGDRHQVPLNSLAKSPGAGQHKGASPRVLLCYNKFNPQAK